MGWHQLENKSAYEPWQVVGLALTLGLLVSAPTLASAPLGLFRAAVVTVSLTVIWSWDAATTPAKEASLWPIGAVLLFACAVAGLTVAWGLTELVKMVLVRRSPRRG